MNMHYFVALSALVAIAWAEPVNAQQVKAGVLTCDVSEGMGYIIGSQKLLSCSFAPEGAGRHEDYDGSITKFGLDLGHAAVSWCGQSSRTQLPVLDSSLATILARAAK
jgi:hypothetical protein